MSTTTTTRTGTVVGSPAISRSAGLPLPTPGMDAQALTNLLKNNFALVVSNRTINAAEDQWLQAIANHPNATAQLKAEVAHKTHGYGLTQGAQRAGVGVFLQTLRSAAGTGGTTVPGTTPAGATPIHPPGGTSIPVTVGTTPGGTTVLGLRMGAAPTQGVPHFKGTATFEGEYALRADALTGAYKGVKADKFGTTDIQLPTGGTHNVRDFHYDLGNGKVGMRARPVVNPRRPRTSVGWCPPACSPKRMTLSSSDHTTGGPHVMQACTQPVALWRLTPGRPACGAQ